MKIALVFDDLIQFGGAERLLLSVHQLYPNAPVYTSVASPEWVQRCKDLGIKLRTSFMQDLPFIKSFNRFYGLLGLHALALESFNFDDYQIVLSISARFAHVVLTKPGTTHICYMNTPGRMFWEPKNYFLNPQLLKLAYPFLSFRRICDFVSAQKVDFFISNSITAQKRLQKYYHRDSCVIYPFAKMDPMGVATSPTNQNYYLVISRLNAWKRVDIAIEACQKAGVKIKIIGEGPEREKLPYGDNVEFLGSVNESQKYQTLSNCTALIVTQKEDFGITPVEAMLCGKPVIAYRDGGVTETVLEGTTGEFFDTQDADSLFKVLSKFNPSKYQSGNCIKQAKNFSEQKFTRQLDGFVKKVYDEQNTI